MIIAYVYWSLCLGIVVVCFVLIVRTNVRLRVAVLSGTNDDHQATQRFLTLLREMETDMIIHDDGDSTATTLYNNNDVVALVRERLDAGGVTIRCLFNKREDIEMVNKLSSRDNFEVHYWPDGSPLPSPDLHYKIIDCGKKAYLSRHRDDGEREYEMIDCTKTPRTGKRLFAKLRKEFKMNVEVAELCG